MVPSLINSSNLNSKFSSDSSSSIRACKVVSIVLDDEHPMFKELGGWSSIGTILFSYVDDVDDIPNPELKSKDNIAVPLFSNNKFYPLINELVYTIQLPTIPNEDATPHNVLYYFSSINLLNSVNHNAYILKSSDAVKFNSIGLPYRNGKAKTTLKLGNNFQDNSSVRPLLPVVGDYIIEGRHGNSIRFGGSLSPKITQWKSDKQANYLIISGRSSNSSDNISVIENINKSDYLFAGFSDHQLDIDLPSVNFDSYKIKSKNNNVQQEQLYEVTDTVQPTQETPVEPVIYDSKPEETVPYETESEEFFTPDYVYVLEEETIKERGEAYEDQSDVTITSVNVVPVTYVTLQQLTLIVSNPIVASKYLRVVNQTLTLYRINTNKRIAHFLAQCLIESLNFTRFEEIGDKDYFNRYDYRPDIGNRIGGDGYKYRGRGAIQITGRYNYKVMNNDLKYGGGIIEASPDSVSKYPLNILSAGWYWNKRSLNSIADTDNISLIRQRVQGSPTDRITDIKKEYNKIIRILGNGTS